MKLVEFERNRLLEIMQFAAGELSYTVLMSGEDDPDLNKKTIAVDKLHLEIANSLLERLEKNDLDFTDREINNCFKFFEMIPSGMIHGIEEVELWYPEFKKHLQGRLRDDNILKQDLTFPV